jgi:hypothetical protein
MTRTSPTWKNVHRRGDILASVITAANTRRDGVLPMDVDGVAATFGDELSLLGALQLKWHTRLAGKVERGLMEQPLDLEGAVVGAWRAAADDLPGVRDVLDHYREHPVDDAMATAMRKATRKEHTTLAMMAGRCSVGDEGAAPIGAALEEQARRGWVRPALPAPERPSLLDRLRAALAA